MQTKVFRQSNARHHPFPQCFSLDLSCSRLWLTVAFIVSCIQHVQRPLLSDTSCNALWVTIPLRHGRHLPDKSTQFISLKAGQNIPTFVGTVPTDCRVTPKTPFLCPWSDPAFRPAVLAWHSRKPSFDLLALKGTLGTANIANIQFFECCMSSYRSPGLNDVLWRPKQIF